jgi:type I restriction enzyme S subunit
MKLKSKWLESINSDWRIVPGNALFSERKAKSLPSDVHLTPSQTYGVLPQADFIQLSGGSVVLNLTGAENMKHVEVNDFIIHLRSFQGGIEHSNYKGKVSNAYCVLKPNNNVEPQFFKWVLKSPGLIQELNATTDQLRDGQSIKFEQFRKIGFPLPERDVQIDIANYLDKKVSVIDTLIEQYLRQLNLGKELFAALLESYTSIDFNIQDPKIRIRRISKLDTVVEIPADMESDVTFLGLEDVQPGNLGNFNRFKSLEEVRSGYSRFIEGDILLPKVSPSFGQGRAVIAPKSVTKVGFASTEIYSIRANNPFDSQYLCACLRARNFLMFGESNYKGVAGVKRVDKESILNWKIRWPESNVRAEIVNVITEAQNNLERLHEDTDLVVQRLNELKEIIITSAIVGGRVLND